MGVLSATLDNNLGSDAEYQAWIQQIEAGLLASGFLEVASDTGQIVPTSVTRPSTGTFSGYRIYRAKDALAATKPLYVKLEFGVGATTARPSLRRTMGTGSNGSGTLSGQVTATAVMTPSADGTGSQLLLAGGGPYGVFLFLVDGTGSNGHNLAWFFGRLVDQADFAANDPIIYEAWSQGGSMVVGIAILWTDGTASWANVTSGLLGVAPDVGGGIHSGGNVSTTRVFQAVVYRNGKTVVFPLLLGKGAELPYTDPGSSQFSLNIWGGFHSFVPVPWNASTAGSRVCMLWEAD